MKLRPSISTTSICLIRPTKAVNYKESDRKVKFHPFLDNRMRKMMLFNGRQNLTLFNHINNTSNKLVVSM